MIAVASLGLFGVLVAALLGRAVIPAARADGALLLRELRELLESNEPSILAGYVAGEVLEP